MKQHLTLLSQTFEGTYRIVYKGVVKKEGILIKFL